MRSAANRWVDIGTPWWVPFAVVTLACNTPGPPQQATPQQVAQMEEETQSSAMAASVSPDWSALARAIRNAADSAERQHYIAEFARHAVSLPDSDRALRLTELRQLTEARR